MFSIAPRHRALLSSSLSPSLFGELLALKFAAWCRQMVLAWILICSKTILGFDSPERIWR